MRTNKRAERVPDCKWLGTTTLVDSRLGAWTRHAYDDECGCGATIRFFEYRPGNSAAGRPRKRSRFRACADCAADQHRREQVGYRKNIRMDELHRRLWPGNRVRHDPSPDQGSVN